MDFFQSLLITFVLFAPSSGDLQQLLNICHECVTECAIIFTAEDIQSKFHQKFQANLTHTPIFNKFAAPDISQIGVCVKFA